MVPPPKTPMLLDFQPNVGPLRPRLAVMPATGRCDQRLLTGASIKDTGKVCVAGFKIPFRNVEVAAGLAADRAWDDLWSDGVPPSTRGLGAAGTFRFVLTGNSEDQSERKLDLA